MQFACTRIAAPRSNEGRSVALRRQLGWCSASNTYAPCLRPNRTCAVEAKAGHFQEENRFEPSPSLPSFLRYCATTNDERRG
jgi:hypothetical protein